MCAYTQLTYGMEWNVWGWCRLKGWEVWEWDGIYQDLPSRHLKVTVADRAAIVTNDDETRALEPKGLQVRPHAFIDYGASGLVPRSCYASVCGGEC